MANRDMSRPQRSDPESRADRTPEQQGEEAAEADVRAEARERGRLALLRATRSRVFIRNFAAADLLELFMVAAVSAVLLIRFGLGLTGYPQLGGAGLHVAHMLWGGLLMVVALFLLLVYLGQRVVRLAAVCAGLGFGIFIDELGKFITSDNNYFYRPAMALIYLIFLALFLLLRAVERKREWSDETYLINALVLLQEAVLHEMDSIEHRNALTMLRSVRDAPAGIAAPLGALMEALAPAQHRRRSAWERAWRRARVAGHRALGSAWLARTIAILFCLRALFFLATVIVLTLALVLRTGPGGSPIQLQPMALVAFVAAFIANVLGLIGVVTLLRSRLAAFVWFKRSVIVSIFLADVFAFYQEQLAAVSSLALDVVLLVVVNALLHHQAKHIASHVARVREGVA
ncbi:MAG TPA: hypothetical protein VIK45_00750 [Candidatus Dormibacteraeota bacterium]